MCFVSNQFQLKSETKSFYYSEILNKNVVVKKMGFAWEENISAAVLIVTACIVQYLRSIKMLLKVNLENPIYSVPQK